jgi:prepilin-type N-terminal cleavage/methylation domain-containing protein
MLSMVEVKMYDQKSAQSGFSLIELLVAIMILAVGLLGLAELQITATKANSQSDTILAASTLAQEVIEDISAMDSNDPMFDTAVTNAVWDTSPVMIEGGGTYDIEYDVVLNYEGITSLCQIVVRVSSNQALMAVGGNRVRSVTASTVKRAT